MKAWRPSASFFDGKTFVPQQAVSVPALSEAVVIVQQDDPAARAQLDAAVRTVLRGGGRRRRRRRHVRQGGEAVKGSGGPESLNRSTSRRDTTS
jgi:hypothetical protein